MFGQFMSQAVPLVGLYGLLAIGYVIVYRATGVLNFSMGGFVLLGAELGFTLGSVGIASVAGYFLVALIGLLCGAGLYAALFRRLAGQPPWIATLVTIALGFFAVPSIAQFVWGAGSRSFTGSYGFSNGLHDFGGGVLLTTIEIALPLVFLIIAALLGTVDRFTRLGIRMRAAAQDSRLADYRGMRVGWLLALTWGISTAAAMAVGFINATDNQLDANAGVLAVSAFPAAMLGGLDSLGGIAIGSIVVSCVVAGMATYGNPNLSELAPFVVLLAVLFIRPWGLFGRPEMIDRV